MDRQPMTQPAELYACLYAREFPAQALLRLRPAMRAKPCAVLAGEPPLQEVCSGNAAARALGVARGMTSVEVSTLPSVVVLSRSHGEEAAAKCALLECAGAFSPRIEDQSQDTAFLGVLDISGTERLFGPPAALAQALLGRTRELGLAACVAVCGNFHAALCLARGMTSSNRTLVVGNGEERDALAPLPLGVLDLPPQYGETFSLWGIRTLGMLAALPEAPLIARMGQEGRRFRQLARGELPHLFLPVEPAFALQEHFELDSPVEALDSLLFVIGVMLEQLMVRAGARVLALASLTLKLSLEGGAIHTLTVKPALPNNDRKLWIKLIHLDLEAHPPDAAVLALTLSAEPGSISKVQLGLFSPQLPEPARLDVTLARIRAIVGEECVGRAVLKDTHGQDSVRMDPFTPFTLPAGKPADAVALRARTAMRRLDPAEPIAVSIQDERPQTLFFRGKRYAVLRAYGPWAASGDWWNAARWSLEQWDAIVRAGEDNLCCSLLRDPGRGTWWMAGLYD